MLKNVMMDCGRPSNVDVFVYVCFLLMLRMLQVTENAALVQYVRARCGEPWNGTPKHGSSGGITTNLEFQGGHGMMDQQAVKMYYSHPSPALMPTTRHFPSTLDSNPWPSSHPWEQEGPMLESQLMGGKHFGFPNN
jgi:hypothetical protein